jgi:glycosyltransferase involved in cell wall biosynthesis
LVLVRVLAFGTYDATIHPRVRVLLAGLEAHGHEVRECNEPLALSTEDRVAALREPWRLPMSAWRLMTSWRRLVRRARREPRPDFVLVGFLGHFDVLLARWVFRGVPIILDHLVGAEETARDRALGGTWLLRLLAWVDRRALRAATVVLVDTEEHRALVPHERTKDTIVVPVGADDDWFAAATDQWRAGAGPLRVVFFGLFTPLQGAPVIGEALTRLRDADVEITMIGHGQDLAATRAAAAANSRVTWHHWVEAAELPSMVAAHDVCLGIFGDGPKARRVVPNKVFQGMAAGCAIVTSNTAPQRRLLGDAAKLVPPGDASALADALVALAGDPAELERMRARALALARELTPMAVTARLVAELQDQSPPARRA